MFGRSKKPARKTASSPSAHHTQMTAVAARPPAQPAQRSWLSQLEGQFLISGQGVVMKVYIENFKRMNDLFGFEQCNALLDIVREYLERKTGCSVFRNVGVEFIIIMRNKTVKDAQQAAEQIIARFGENWIVEDKKFFCTAQIALCAYPGFPTSAGELLKYLDLAILSGTDRGSNQIVVYDNELHGQYLRRQAIAKNISTAITKEQVEISYRPIYSQRRGRFTRAELLMRLFIPEMGMIGSEEYLPIAEDTGQLRVVEYYMLNQAAAAIARLLEEGKKFESIAVSIPPSLLLHGDFIEEISQLIEEYQIPPKKLALEIDEFTAGSAYCDISVLLQNLSWLGVELVLDNFGSGSTGLSWIFELPVDTLKFNPSFVWQLENNKKSRPINEGLVQIARRMKKKLIASGVNTQRQKELLDHLGCDLQQGAFLSPIMPEQELMAVLSR